MIFILSILLVPVTNIVSVNAASGTPVTITVKSVDLSGNPITGMSTVIRYTNGTTISESFTPVSFTVKSGTTYVVHVRNYQITVFNHWMDGSTNSYYTITPTQNVILTAYYSTGISVTAPQPPTGLTATAVSTSQINLSWTAPANNGGSAITGYKIERSTDSGTTWSTIVSNTGSTATTFSDTGL
ncbi:MAG: fibronectin type III domain-containing protein, partial [Thaumarchaeota archaeon]